jgi:hypothetical protein
MTHNETSTQADLNLELVNVRNTRQLRGLAGEIVRLLRMPGYEWMEQERPKTRRLFGSHIAAEGGLRKLSAHVDGRRLNLYTIRSEIALLGLAWIQFGKSVDLDDGSPPIRGHRLDYILRPGVKHDSSLASNLIKESQRIASDYYENTPASAVIDSREDVMMVTVPIEAKHEPSALTDHFAGFSLRGIAKVTSPELSPYDDSIGQPVKVYTAAFA